LNLSLIAYLLAQKKLREVEEAVKTAIDFFSRRKQKKEGTKDEALKINRGRE
jgi:hypothetical protein